MSDDADSKLSSDKLNSQKKSDIIPQSHMKETNYEGTEHEPLRSLNFKILETTIENLDSSTLPHPDAKNTLLALKDLQYKQLQLEEAYRKEWSQLKLKFLEKFKPLYFKRWVTLTGREPPAENTDAGLQTQLPESDVSCSVQSGTKMIPKFWLKTLKNNLALSEMIEEHDEPILEYLEDIRFNWVNNEEQTSFKLEFVFAVNPYFKNATLSKTYYLEPSDVEDEESILTKAEGTEIQWHKGKNVTETTLLRKQRNKRTNATRVVTDVIKVNSFFNYFKTHEVPSEAQLDSLTEDDVSGLEMIMETEFELGAILRDRIIPRAIGWYLGTEQDDFASDYMDEYEDQEESEETLDEQE